MVFVVLVIYLLPLYWISSTAFKPRNLATTVPPTVVFKPDLTAFVKLFTDARADARRGGPRGVRQGALVGEAGARFAASASSRTPTATSRAPATGRAF